MLLEYGAKNVYAVGLTSKKQITKSDKKEYSRKILLIATQAYLLHGLIDESEKQEKFIEDISEKLSTTNISLIIRKHPRDNTTYNINPNIKISQEPTDEFLTKYITHCDAKPILLSPPSTLLIEWVKAGLDAILLKDSRAKDIYSRILSPIDFQTGRCIDILELEEYLIKNAIDFKLITKENIMEVYSNEDLSRFKENVKSDLSL